MSRPENDDEVDALFTVAPDEFTGARDALVKRLRAAGERDAAKAVAGLRRPKLAAWAMNQVVRSDPAAAEELLEAGAAMRDQQRRLLSGVKAPQLRAASATRRAAIEAFVAKAVAVLEERGANPQAHVAEITSTLEAASVDEEAAEQALAGRLSAPLASPTGFGGLPTLSLAVTEKDRSESDVRQPAEGKRRRQAREALDEAHALADDAEAALQRARGEVRAATREAESTREAAVEAQAAAVAKRRDADRLLRASEEAAARAERARTALEAIEEQVAATRRKAHEAERALEQLD